MFHFLASSVASFVPDEDGNLIAFDKPLLQIDPGDSSSPDYAMASIKMFLTLVALALLFGVTVWFLRRLIRQRLERGTGMQSIRILEKKMISPKTILYILDIEGEKIVMTESQLEVRQLKTALNETEKV